MLNEKKKALKGALGKVTDKVGAAMALPWTISHGMKEKKSNSEADILRKARLGKGSPQFHGGKATEAFKYQTLADGIKQRRAKK